MFKSHQSQFYQELNAFQTNLYKNELDVFSESLDFLNNVTQKLSTPKMNSQNFSIIIWL